MNEKTNKTAPFDTLEDIEIVPPIEKIELMNDGRIKLSFSEKTPEKLIERRLAKIRLEEETSLSAERELEVIENDRKAAEWAAEEEASRKRSAYIENYKIPNTCRPVVDSDLLKK